MKYCQLINRFSSLDSCPSIKTNLAGAFSPETDTPGRDPAFSPLSDSSMGNSGNFAVDDTQIKLNRLQSENEFLQECLKRARDDYILIKAELIEVKKRESESEVSNGQLYSQLNLYFI